MMMIMKSKFRHALMKETAESKLFTNKKLLVTGFTVKYHVCQTLN